MLEFLVLFSLAATGSLVNVWANLVCRLVARKSGSETVATGPGRAASASSAAHGDPVLAFGFTLAAYGAISLLLVSAFPGELMLERTCLAFAVLCVGGLLSEISHTRASPRSAVDSEEDGSVEREPLSRRVSLTLALMLNLAFAVVSTGQGLIQIVPPRAVPAARTQEMEPITVVARRTNDATSLDSGAL